MSEIDQTNSGLNTLSQSQLEALNAWLLSFIVHDAQMVKNSHPDIERVSNERIISRISGSFSGWGGDTLFYLNNGQVWKQRTSGRWRINLQNPEVHIMKNAFGFYELKIVGRKKKIGVKRVK